MSDDFGKVDELLDELDLDDGAADTPTSRGENRKQPIDDQPGTADRLRKLRDAGVITDEEYELLRAHHDSDDGLIEEESGSSSSDPQEFGTPLATSKGTDVDFSVLGVFEDVDTAKLTTSETAEFDVWDDVDVDFPSDNKGGPGRTLVFWQIYNHSSDEVTLKHKHIDQIGSDKIAYNRDENPLQVHHFEPGWRTDNWADISSETRIKYVSAIEIPVQLSEVKIDGYCSDIHKINITDEMRFSISELPVTVDL